MSTEGYEYQPQYEGTRNMHEQCKRHMEYHVIISMKDGSSFDGVIVDVGSDNVSVLVGEDVMERENEEEARQFYGGFGRPRRRFRRFRRRNFPIASLAALALLPYIAPYPYPYPYYPYSPYPYY
ncbi:small nuclear ribonucleoprotein [Halobacillus sp. MO56]